MDLSKLSDDELEAKNQALMAKRAEVEQDTKAQQMDIARELDRRALLQSEGAQALLAALPEDVQSAVLESIGG